MRALALSLALLLAACTTTDPGGRMPETFVRAADACVERCKPRTELGLECVCQIRVKIRAKE